MKKLLVLFLVMFLAAPALAEFDAASLRADESLNIFSQSGTLNTVYRPLNQPFIGQVDEEYEGYLVAYVDYIGLVDLDVTLLRMVISTEVFDLPLNADEARITIGGKSYTFPVTPTEDEYDGLYMEDHSFCLTDASLPLMKAIAQQKHDDPIRVEMLRLGEVVFAGLVVIPGEEAASMYDRFIDLGGKSQGLKKLDEIWPCRIEKLK